MKTADKYVIKALDSYPYNLEETIESLDYALAYDEHNATALMLYGKLLSEQMQKHEESKYYFERALATNIYAIEVYVPYIEMLIKNEDYQDAQKMIDFALTTKGTDKATLMLKNIEICEINKEYKKGLEILEEVKLKVTNSDYNTLIEDTEKRLKNKNKPPKNTSNKNKKNK